MKSRLELIAESPEDDNKLEAALRAEDLLLAFRFVMQKLNKPEIVRYVGCSAVEVIDILKSDVSKMLESMELKHLVI
jgi:hypothetical protein